MIGLPSPSPLTEPFWDGAADRRLVRQVCEDCGTNLFTPRIACHACQSERLTWQDSAGVGTVYSHSVVHRSPTGDRDVPYVVAIVDLDEGWHMMTNIVGVDPADVHIGQRVSVAWEDRDGRRLPVFTPATDTAPTNTAATDTEGTTA